MPLSFILISPSYVYIFAIYRLKMVLYGLKHAANLSMYVGHLESKERLRIQPAQLFLSVADESCGVFIRVWTVAWCSSCSKLSHVVSVIG